MTEPFTPRLFYVRRRRLLTRIAAAMPATVRQNIRVLSQIPNSVLGTIREAWPHELKGAGRSQEVCCFALGQQNLTHATALA
jgi:hypothetical protein